MWKFSTIFSFFKTRTLRYNYTFNIRKLNHLFTYCPPNRFLNMSGQKPITSHFRLSSSSDKDGKTGDSQIDRKVKDPSKKEEFIFFFGQRDVFSQFHKVDFVVYGEQYCCMEQCMHHQKALTFKDHKTATAIMQTTEPITHKRLGRKVTPFDKTIWAKKSIEIVREGNIEKFGQNEQLRNIMFSTCPKTLVEASPRDRLWGIGLGRNNEKARDRSQWRGKNLLGKTLTEVRGILMKKFNIDPEEAAKMPELGIAIPPSPIKAKSMKDTTSKAPSKKETPSKKPSTKDTPSKTTPTKDTPSKTTSTKDTSSKTTPTKDTHTMASKNESVVYLKEKDVATSTVQTKKTPNKDRSIPKAKSSSSKKRKQVCDNDKALSPKKRKLDFEPK